MSIAVLIILIVVGGVILWGALTDWTFSGIFGERGDAERDSPPGPISNVQLGVATGGRRESYTTLEEMEGLSITVSFNTPKSSFGTGNLELRDYVISLGTATGNNPREDLLAVIVIPRNNATGGTLLITSSGTKTLTSGEITLSGDFNATDTRVSITLSDPVWRGGNIIISQGDVFLGIDYTSMEVPEGHVYELGGEADKPAGNYTKYFMAGGVTLSGTIQDNGVFVVNPDVTTTVNEELNMALEQRDIGGILEIRKQINNYSRFLISTATLNKLFLGTPRSTAAIKASIFGEPQGDCKLNTFRLMPMDTTDPVGADFLNGIPENEFWGPESNWFNFVIMEEHVIEERPTGWVRLGLISNFEEDPNARGKIRVANFPVIHPVHQMASEDNFLSFQKYVNANQGDTKTYFRFVSPVDSSSSEGGQKFSLCVRRVNLNDINNSLSKPLNIEDLFLTMPTSRAWSFTRPAELKRLKDIDNNSYVVFTMRNPDSAPATYTVPNEGMDKSGHDIKFGISDTNLEDCKTLCNIEPTCVGISHSINGNWCYPKSSGVLDVDPVVNGFTFYQKI